MLPGTIARDEAGDVGAAAPAVAPAPAGAACVSCGHRHDEPYCPRCGERRAADRRYSLRHFAGEAFEVLTDVDGTFWRTLRALLTRPGELTAAYMRGQRRVYMKPLQLFLIVNVAYFVWVGWAGERVFSTPLSGHLQHDLYGELVRRMIVAKVQEPGMTAVQLNAAANAYGDRFNEAAVVQAKSLIVAMVPMFALLLALVQVRRRQPFVQHLVFALHTYTALLVFAIAQRYLVQYPALWATAGLTAPRQYAIVNWVVSWVMIGAMCAYVTLGLRRVDGARWRIAVAKGVVLGMSTLVILVVYRVLLFFTVYWTT